MGFWVRHLMVTKVHGAFTKWSGTLALDEDDVTRSQLDVRIDVASIDTKEAQRDGHLRSPDFFDVEKYPEMIFKSTSVERASDGNLRVRGDLSLHGVTKSVTLDVEDSGRAKHPMTGDLRAGFSARTSILRSDFGLTWNAVLEAGGVAVSDKVEINLEIQAFRPA
ncbi:YceI family protein [Minicystis rosea]|nr:YceI family protein [Minicystis rosea]